jgi:hypothetical protein
MRKRSRLDKSPYGTALRLFEDDIIDESLLDDGSFVLRNGATFTLNQALEIMEANDGKGLFTTTKGNIKFDATQKEPATSLERRKIREETDPCFPVSFKNVQAHVHPDHHAKWMRVITTISKQIDTTKPMDCVNRGGGAHLAGSTPNIWHADIVALENNADVAAVVFYERDDDNMFFRVTLQ